MTLETKDIIYILLYIISMISVFLAFKNRLSNVEKTVSRGMKVLYKEAGALNIIDHDTCKRNRDEIFTAIRRSERAMEMLLGKLEELNKNVLLISFKMDAMNGEKNSDNL